MRSNIEDHILELYKASFKGCVATLNTLIQAHPDILHNENYLASFNETPLHVSASVGHLEFTKKLLSENPQLASRVDSLRRSPLHLASAEGHVKIVKALLGANTKVCMEFDEEGNIPLHLAVMKGHVEVIKELIKEQPRSFFEKSNGKYTVVQLAVKNNQLEALEFACDEDSNSWLIRKTKWVYKKCRSYLKHQSNWVEEMQGTLMLVATLTATISFQVAVNPPGGVWQEDVTDNTGGSYCNDKYGKCVAGNAVLGYVYDISYTWFTRFAIIAFISSLSVVLLGISGFPLKNKFCTWLMTIAMIFAITFLLLTFTQAIGMVTPDHIFLTTATALDYTEYVWIGLVGLVVLFATIRLLFWLVSFLCKSICFMKNQYQVWRLRIKGRIC